MMKGVARDVFVATLAVLAVTGTWAGMLGFAQIAQALLFAMAFAAYKVGVIIFLGDRE